MIEEDEEYLLLYEDGISAQFLPGEGKEFFELSKYKEVLGKDYRIIVLYPCQERDYEYNYELCSSSTNTCTTDEEESKL